MKMMIIKKGTEEPFVFEGQLSIIFGDKSVVNTTPKGLQAMVKYYLENNPDVIHGSKVYPEQGGGDDYPVIPR